MRAAVVIGHFGCPGLIDLQLHLIPHHNGPTPVLVTDDHTDEAWSDARGEGPQHGRDRLARLQEVCRRRGVPLKTAGPERLKHGGGDLAAYYHGLHYAKAVGAGWLVKLSPRLLIDRPNWIAELIEDAESIGSPTSTMPCMYGPNTVWPIRSECVGMRVSAWHRPELVDPANGLLRPRLLNGLATEIVIGQALQVVGATVSGPRWWGPDRTARYDRVWWHDQEPHRDRSELEAEARATAKRYGIDLGPEFHAKLQHHGTPGYAGF